MGDTCELGDPHCEYDSIPVSQGWVRRIHTAGQGSQCQNPPKRS